MLADYSKAEPSQQALAEALLDFARLIPSSAGLEWVSNFDFLFYFEAERLLAMRRVLIDSGFDSATRLRVLDFGYLHGLVPEFLHRFFPNSTFTVLDHPNSPNFRNPEYLALIRSRDYLDLQPYDIAEITSRDGQYDLIVLGEFIEHIDPTLFAKAAAALRQKVTDGGRLLITTPNAAGIINSVYTFLGRDAQHPPIPEPTMNYGHIHLWTPTLLARTLAHYGWSPETTRFTHGFDSLAFRDSNRHWGSIRHQILLKLLFAAACLRPAWRGFMVSSWKPAAGTTQ